MTKRLIAAGAVFSFLAVVLMAQPTQAVEKTDGFVCPVIKTDNVLHSPKSGTLGGDGGYTIGGPDVSVPLHATNMDGAGSPGGAHAFPGDEGYTAIWP